MLSSKDIVKKDDRFNSINKIRNELKSFISKIKSEGISEELSDKILKNIFLSTNVVLGEAREHIPILKSIYSEEAYTLREFIRANKFLSYKKTFSFPELNFTECDGKLVIGSGVDENNRLATVTNTGRPSLLVDELKLVSVPTTEKSHVYKSPFPFLERVYLKPIDEDGFKQAFKTYITKRIISEFNYLLQLYTTSDFMSDEKVNSMLRMLENLNNKNKG
jgi:hypothetical protein